MSAEDLRADWLVRALADYSPQTAYREVRDEEAIPMPGELRLVEPMDPERDAQTLSRLALVLDVDQNNCSAVVALVANLIENATDLDVLLDPSHTGLGYRIVVESDIVGTVWSWQCPIAVGRVDQDVLEVVQALPRTRQAGAWEGTRGLPLSGCADPRWSWKESEVAQLQALSADCVATLLAPAWIDPGLFDMEFADEDHTVAALLDTARLLEEGSARVSGAAIEEAGWADTNTMEGLVAILGVDALVAVQASLLSAVSQADDWLTAPGDTPSIPHRRPGASRDPLKRVVAAEQQRGSRSARLMTWPHLWLDDDEAPVSVGSFRLLRQFSSTGPR